MRTNVIYCDDNLVRLAQFPDESVDLIYLDPPFFSNKKYEVIWGDEGEVRSFEDRWEGGIEVYVQWMKERVIEMQRILKDTGSIYLHCDWHASHYLKVMMDDVFGYGNFQNDIVWYYRGAGVSKKRFGRRHDIILFYTKSRENTFNIDDVRTPYAEATQERFKHHIGNIRKGRDFGLQTLHPKGKHPDDVWQIQPVAPSDTVRKLYNYPTLKPEALLERIIKASSNEGDVVLDPFCGCGTTVVVAERLERKWIGIDISPTACSLMKLRLNRTGVKNVSLIGMPVTIGDLKKLKPFEFQNWVVIEGFNGSLSPRKVGDKGIDGFTFMSHDPIQVKQSEKVGRNVVDNFQTAVERTKKQKGYIVAFSFTRGAKEEAARCKRQKGLEIKLVPVKDLLKKMHSKGSGQFSLLF